MGLSKFHRAYESGFLGFRVSRFRLRGSGLSAAWAVTSPLTHGLLAKLTGRPAGF